MQETFPRFQNELAKEASWLWHMSTYYTVKSQGRACTPHSAQRSHAFLSLSVSLAPMFWALWGAAVSMSQLSPSLSFSHSTPATYSPYSPRLLCCHQVITSAVQFAGSVWAAPNKKHNYTQAFKSNTRACFLFPPSPLAQRVQRGGPGLRPDLTSPWNLHRWWGGGAALS